LTEKLLINRILRKIANDSNILFVDNERLFQGLWDRGEVKQDYHYQFRSILDNHCNSRGYEFMAKNIFDVIRKEDMLKLTNKARSM